MPPSSWLLHKDKIICENQQDIGKNYLEFRGNSEIGSFDELQYFTGVKVVGGNIYSDSEFYGSNFESVTIPIGLITSTNQYALKQAFRDHTKLKTVTFMAPPVFIHAAIFCNCISLEHIKGIIWESIEKIESEAFYRVPLNGTYSLNLKALTKIGVKVFVGCTDLKYLNLGKISEFGTTAFNSSTISDCFNLETLVLGKELTIINYWSIINCPKCNVYIQASTPPTTSYTFNRGMSAIIYVPIASVNAYKSATNWSEASSRIVGYDFENDPNGIT